MKTRKEKTIMFLKKRCNYKIFLICQKCSKFDEKVKKAVKYFR